MNQITYTIAGLATSQSTVLRAMLLLSEKSLNCTWHAVTNTNEHTRADVFFLGEAADSDAFYPRAGQVFISIGDGPKKQNLHLDLPLVFPLVAKLLFSVTQTVLHQKTRYPEDANSLQPSIYNLDFLPPSSSHEDTPVSGQLYKLKTWPPAGVIGNNRSYMRAAAVLTGKSLTSSQLAEKTSLPLGDCRQFIGKLSDSRCLDIAAPGSTPSAPGLASSAGASPAVRLMAAPSMSTNAAAAHNMGSSLFNRIRARLGFLGKTST